MYEIVFSEEAKKDLKELNKKAPKAINKLENLLLEIKEHPRTGTGKVEVLKGYDGNILSRRISSEHLIIYRVKDDSVEVLVLSVFGHYR